LSAAPSRLPPPPFLYPILDRDRLGERPLGPALLALAAGGVRLVQLRAKDQTDAAFLAWIRPAVASARSAGLTVIVNDRPDLALIVGADGVHVGQDDLSPADCRRLLGPEAVIGLSTHGLEQVEAALREPIDYLAVGPVFATTGKRAPDPVVGLELVRRARERTRWPLVAIGGIDAGRARSVVEAGADGLAVIGALLGGADLATAVQALRAAMRPETLR
jgi:thiamine-phosphate pyrophosphorylase